MPDPEALRVIEPTMLEERPAIVSYPEPGSSLDGKAFIRVSFVDGDIETTVIAHRLDLASVIEVTRSLVSAPPPPTMATDVPAATADEQETGEPLGTNSPSPVGAVEHRVVSGITLDSVRVTTWWHSQRALDLVNNMGGPTEGTNVYEKSRAIVGPEGFITEILPYPGLCTGVYISLVDAGFNLVGYLRYTHIEPSVYEGQRWFLWGSGWTTQHVGTILADEKDQCKYHVPPLWTGAHLHQGADDGYPYIEHNAGLEGYVSQAGHPNVLQPSSDYNNQWIHRLFTIDADGDGCSDQEELGMGFDPHAWYDFYDVPVPAAPDPTPNGPRNKAVNFQDVLAVLAYVGAYQGGPPNLNGMDYDSDKNSDGRPDGMDYDRLPGPLPNPPNDAGPPSGAVSMQDVLVVLGQTGLDCTQPP
jgi:hypothetical protein